MHTSPSQSPTLQTAPQPPRGCRRHDGALPCDVRVGGREWCPSGNLLLPAQSDPAHSSRHPGPAAHAEVGKNFSKEKLLPLTDA